MTEFVLILALWSGLGANAARENQRGLDALAGGDTTKALKHFDKASRADTSDPRYAYNLGTVQARTRKISPDAALGQALSHAKSDQERARILYNRGTARYETAKAKHAASTSMPMGAPAGSAPQGNGQAGQDNGKDEVNGAVEDLRQALKYRPGWNEAARNLDLALKLRQQCNKPNKDKDDDKKNKDQDQKQPQPQPQNQMQQQDAQRLLEAAQAQENNQAKKPPQKRKEDEDGPDW